MRALSFRQPWAHAILHLGKRVENRDWSGCAYRGPVLLHASSKVVLRPTKGDPETFGDAVESILKIVKPARGAEAAALLKPLAYWSNVSLPNGRPGPKVWRPAPTLPLSGIVGRARIVDVGRVADTGHIWDDDNRPLGCKLGCGGVWGVAYDRSKVCPKASPWAVPGSLGLVLADVEPLPFTPWRGSLGLFDVPDDVAKEAEARKTFAEALRGIAERNIEGDP